jgi:hypothetical protein
MKTLTLYCDKDLVFRWNEWPEKPKFIDRMYEVEHCINDINKEQYQAALELAKRESKPFEDQKIIQLILQTMEGKVDLSPFKPDTFYSFPFEGKVEVIEVPEYPIDHTSYPPMIKVAKLNPRKHP